jgi:hypothetical protein
MAACSGGCPEVFPRTPPNRPASASGGCSRFNPQGRPNPCRRLRAAGPALPPAASPALCPRLAPQDEPTIPELAGSHQVGSCSIRIDQGAASTCRPGHGMEAHSFDHALYGGGGAWGEGGGFILANTSRTLLSKIIRISSSVRSTCATAIFRISSSFGSRSLSSSGLRSRSRSPIAVPLPTSMGRQSPPKKTCTRPQVYLFIGGSRW